MRPENIQQLSRSHESWRSALRFLHYASPSAMSLGRKCWFPCCQCCFGYCQSAQSCKKLSLHACSAHVCSKTTGWSLLARACGNSCQASTTAYQVSTNTSQREVRTMKTSRAPHNQSCWALPHKQVNVVCSHEAGIMGAPLNQKLSQISSWIGNSRSSRVANVWSSKMWQM